MYGYNIVQTLATNSAPPENPPFSAVACDGRSILHRPIRKIVIEKTGHFRTSTGHFRTFQDTNRTSAPQAGDFPFCVSAKNAFLLPQELEKCPTPPRGIVDIFGHQPRFRLKNEGFMPRPQEKNRARACDSHRALARLSCVSWNNCPSPALNLGSDLCR